jgi:glycosyltransferase involved in cell wall biosynthesis
MAKIFINGLQSKAGGGKSILNNYLSLLMNNNQTNNYIVLTPKLNEYEKYRCDHIDIIDIEGIFKRNILAPYVNHYLLPRLLDNLNIDLLFNLGDIVIPTNKPQIYLFDWPYAIYPESEVWKRLDIKSYLQRKIKLYFFRAYIGHAKIIIAQTETAKIKLEKLFNLKNIRVVPNAVSLENINDLDDTVDFMLPRNKIKLLYLTYYYPHKNIEVFIPLAHKIKEMALPYALITTIESSQHVKARRFLDDVCAAGLNDTIINVGPVKMNNVPCLYKQCDGLLMPTLLESFSGTYVEALYHGKAIITSDLDFAKDVCGEAAFYFDPLSYESILSSLKLAFDNDDLRNNKIIEGKKRLDQLLTWEQAFNEYQFLIDKELSGSQ